MLWPLGFAAISVLREKIDLVDFFDFGALSASATFTSGSAQAAPIRSRISRMSALLHHSACKRALHVPTRRAVLVMQER